VRHAEIDSADWIFCLAPWDAPQHTGRIDNCEIAHAPRPVGGASAFTSYVAVNPTDWTCSQQASTSVTSRCINEIQTNPFVNKTLTSGLPIGSGEKCLMIWAHWLPSVYPLGEGRHAAYRGEPDRYCDVVGDLSWNDFNGLGVAA
jgi:hypothetical protein